MSQGSHPPAAEPLGWFARLEHATRIYDAPEPLAGEFRARQLGALIQLMPLTLFANAVCSLLTVVAFWNHAPRSFLLVWLAVVLAVTSRGMPTWLVWRRGQLRPTASQRSVRRAIVQACAMGAIWALMPIVLLPDAPPQVGLIGWIIAAGMMCAGGYALPTVPLGGTIYLCLLAGGAWVAAAITPGADTLLLSALIAIYLLISCSSVWMSGRYFGQQLMSDAEARRQQQVVGLLLRDFEENASDLLWEIDGEGRMRHITERAAEVLGLPAGSLLRVSLVNVLGSLQAELPPSQRRGLSELQAHFDAGRPFRDHLLTISRSGSTAWWQISAKPLLNAQGEQDGWRGVATDVTAQQQATAQLRHLAHYDTLTQLTNRHQFQTAFQQLLEPGVGGTLAPVALLCLDLDHFKTTNDTLGHAAGDALLVEVARRLQSSIREGDIAARLGGDEFALVVRGPASEAEAGALAQRVIDAIQQPFEHHGVTVPVRTSVGLALVPRDGTQAEMLLRHADLALYEAKAAGRSQYRFFESAMAHRTQRRSQVERGLRTALERQEFSLAFQPKVALEGWRINGFEALLRWQHPELGSVSPTEFIPVAEETGLIHSIGEWALHEACRQACTWPDALTVSVNVSPVQATGGTIHDAVRRALSASGLQANRLECEITESIFIAEEKATMEVLGGLHELGVRVALDDFGTGYSSLAYLRRFPLDTLKIDRAFVRELRTRRDAQAIVRTILSLAHTLNMATVAEGVEDVEQVRLLRQEGCQSIQGYFVSRPMSAGEVVTFIYAFHSAKPPGVLGRVGAPA